MRTLGVWVAAAAATALMAWPTAASAIVNVQPLVASADKDGFKGELTGKLDWRTGNSDVFIGAVELLLSYRDDIYTLIWRSDGELGTTGDGETFAERVFTHLRYQVAVAERVTFETFAQLARDRFTRRDFRGLVGAGPRVTLLQDDSARAYFGVAVMAEHEQYSDAPGLADSGAERTNARLSSYVTGRVALDDRLSLIGTVYYQPRLDAFGDYRLLADAKLAVKLTETLALSITFLAAYNADPPETVDGLDTGLTVGFTVGF